MNINITGHNIEITSAIKEFTEKKFNRLKTHQDATTKTYITFNVDKLDQTAEAQIHIPGHTIVAEAKSETLYAAIDALVDKLQRQLTKYKEKQTDYR